MGVPLLVAQNWGKIKEFLFNLWSDISKLLAKAWQGIKDTATDFWDGLFKSAFDWGKNLINNIIDGIKSMINKVKDTVSNVANTIKSFLGFSSPTEEGPGSDADKWAPNFMSMYSRGLIQGIPNVRASVNAIAEEMASLATVSVQPSVQAFDASSVDFADRLTNTLASAIGTVMLSAMQVSNVRGSDSNNPIEVVLEIDRTKIGRVMLTSINDEAVRLGYKPILRTT